MANDGYICTSEDAVFASDDDGDEVYWAARQEAEAILSGEIEASDKTKELARQWLTKY